MGWARSRGAPAIVMEWGVAKASRTYATSAAVDLGWPYAYACGCPNRPAMCLTCLRTLISLKAALSIATSRLPM